jgi:hypothetical protein
LVTQSTSVVDTEIFAGVSLWEVCALCSHASRRFENTKSFRADSPAIHRIS